MGDCRTGHNKANWCSISAFPWDDWCKMTQIKPVTKPANVVGSTKKSETPKKYLKPVCLQTRWAMHGEPHFGLWTDVNQTKRSFLSRQQRIFWWQRFVHISIWNVRNIFVWLTQIQSFNIVRYRSVVLAAANNRNQLISSINHSRTKHPCLACNVAYSFSDPNLHFHLESQNWWTGTTQCCACSKSLVCTEAMHLFN